MIKLVLGKGYHFGDRLCWPRTILQDGVYNNNMEIVGASGTGKSQFLLYLIKQLILHSLKFPGKHSVIVIDPHDTLLEAVLAFIASISCLYPITDQVILINPGNQRYGSPGINVLEPLPGTHPFESIAEIVSACKAIWQADWGPRLESILFNAASLLQEHSLTFAQLPRVLTDSDFRKKLVAKSNNRDVRLYWEKHFNGFRDNEQRYFVESSRNKVAAFLACPYTRQALSQQRSTINFFEAMNSGKIILINLSRSRMKTENRRLFGSLVLTKTCQSGIARERIPEEARVPVSIIVDQVHEVFNKDAVLPILEGGRKFNIQIIMAHQALAQLQEEDIDVILGNAATLVTFSCGPPQRRTARKRMLVFRWQRNKIPGGRLIVQQKRPPHLFHTAGETQTLRKGTDGPKNSRMLYSLAWKIRRAIHRGHAESRTRTNQP